MSKVTGRSWKGLRAVLVAALALSTTACFDFDNALIGCVDAGLCGDESEPSFATAAGLADSYVGEAYGQALVVADGTAPITYALTAGALPEGIALGAAGELSGTPTSAATATFTVTATDRIGRSAQREFTLQVLVPPSITTSAVEDAYLAQSYSFPLAVTGGRLPFSYAISAGELPPGLTLSSGGSLTGTAAIAGPATFTVTATDANGRTSSQALTLEVFPLPNLPSRTLADAYLAAPYGETLTATGGKTPLSYSVTAGATPEGLLFNSDGTFGGAATSTVSGTFTVTVSDANGRAHSQAYTVAPLTLPQITTLELLDGYRAEAYSAAFSASGGRAPLSFTLSAGALPAGLSLSSTGTLTGSPGASASTQTFTVLATDANGVTASRQFTLAIYLAPVLPPDTLVDGYVASPYADSLLALNGKGPISYVLTSGSLPAGISFSNGTFSGTPTAATAPVTLNIEATDANGRTASRGYPLGVYAEPSITTGGFSDQYTGTSLSGVAVATTGGKAPLGFMVTGPLPPGLSLDGATGAITGNPTTPGDYPFTVQLTDGNGHQDSAALSLTVFAPPSYVSGPQLGDGVKDSLYSETVQVAGGKAPLTFVLSGSLPNGLTLNTATGEITGTPTVVNPFSFFLQVNDANGRSSPNSQFSITIYDQMQVNTGTNLPPAYQEVAYSQQLVVIGGKSPFSWALNASTLPADLVLTSGGEITGSAQAPVMDHLFSVIVTDANGDSATKSFNLDVVGLPVIAGDPLPDAYVGVPFTASVQVDGGKTPYFFSKSAGTFPSGINQAVAGSNDLVGTPNLAGVSNFTMRVTDDHAKEDTQSFTLTTYAVPDISTASALTDAYQGQAFTQTLAVSGGKAPFTWAVTSGSPPAGLTLATDGVLSGTPSGTGAASFSATVTDSNGRTATKPFTQTVHLPVTLSATFPDGYVGRSYGPVVLSGAGGRSPYTFALASGSSLPAGLSLSGDTLSGTPTAAVAAASFTLEARDANNELGTQDFSVDVLTPPSVATASLPDAYSGTAYTTTLLGQDGAGGYSWRLVAGTLPTGLTLNAAGELAGTTTQLGPHSLTVEVSDANGITATRVLSLVVRSPLQVTTTTLADAYLSRSYAATLTAGGGLAPYSFQRTGGTLPASLTLAADGTLSGTPDASGLFSLDVEVTDANAATAISTLQLRVRVLPQVTTVTLPDGYEQRDYAATLAGTGGKTPYQWTVTTGTLPTGLTLATSGTLTGTPTTAGSHPITVTLTDDNGQTGTADLTLDVHTPLQITTAALDDAYLTRSYDLTVAASGGPAGGYTWAATGLPAGVSLNTGTGQLTGIPTAAGSSQVALTVTDGNGLTAQRTLSLETYAMPRFTSTSPLADAYVGSTYAPVLAAADGKPPYALSSVDPLPPGLTLEADGTFTGTVSSGAGSTYSFLVQLQDANGVQVSASFEIPVLATLVVDTTSVADLYTGTAYTLPFAASGGLTPYTWSLASGSSAPAGMTFSSLGVLDGTPTAAGTHGFTVRVIDANTRSAQASLTAQIFAPPLVTTTTLSEAFVGEAYSRTLSSTGGKAGFTWSAVGLPSWLSLDSGTGVLSGTPTGTETGVFFTVTVTDLNGRSDDQLLSVDVRNDFFITTSALPDAYVGTPFNEPFAASGGVLPYTWAGLTLPPGMALDPSTGVLSGPPPAAGSYPVQVQATDDSATTDTVDLTLVVLNPPAVTTTTLSDGYLTENVAQTLGVAGGKAPFTWSVSSGALPTGVTLTASTGALSGVPTTLGDHPVTFMVQDANNRSATAALTLSIYSLPRDETPTAPPAAYRGVAYSFPQVGTGGKAPLSWLASALPDGLTLNAVSGEISGTPSAAAVSTSFTATVRDANGREAQSSRTITVHSPPRNTTAAFAGGWVNVSYSHPLTAADGVAPYSYSFPAGQLPAGLSIGLSGGVVAVTGTPESAGTFSLQLTVTDANGQTDVDAYTLSITPALQLTTTSLPSAYAGEPSYGGTLAASGGRSPYSFAVQSGSLPEGMTLNTDGTFAGGASTETSTTFVAQVTDANNSLDLQNLTLVVVAAPQLVAGAVPPAYVEELFVQSNSAIGGVSPYSWSISAGALPTGVTLDANTGELRGTPTTAGPVSFTLTVSDANARTDSHAFSFTVLTPVQLTGRELVDAYVARTYSAGIAGSGGLGPYQYFLTTSAAPPPGIVLGTNGVFSGSVTAAAIPGPYSFGITVQDANGRIASASFVIHLYRMPLVATTTLAPAYEGVDYRVDSAGSRQLIQGLHGKPPLTVTVTGLAPGLAFNPATSEVSGIPSANLLSAYTVGVSVSDANNQTSGANLTLNVSRPAPIPGGGLRAAAPQSSPITDMLTVYTLTPQGAPAGDVGVRIRRNGIEYSTPREGVTGPDGRVVFSGLGLNGTTDTVDITANGATYTNMTFAQINAAVVTLALESHELPGRRSSMTSAWDPAASEWFVFGGYLMRGFPSLDEVGSQQVCSGDVVKMRDVGDGQTAWEELRPTGIQSGAPARTDGAMVKAGTELYLFGGRDCATGNPLGDQWAYNPGTGAWTQRLASGPGARFDHPLATRGNSGDPVYLFGGRNWLSYFNDLWLYQPGTNTWAVRTPTPAPTPRFDHAMAVDPLTGELWTCGGYGSLGANGECWSYSPSTNLWTAQAALPGTRYGHQMVFDGNGDLYVFGGYSSTAPAGFRNDLLRYSGGTWVVETANGATGSPAPRNQFSMAHDQLNNRLLIYGGNVAGSSDASVWAWPVGGGLPWVRLDAPPGPVGPLVQISGTISGGATSSSAGIEITLSTSGGEKRTVSFPGASGSFTFGGLRAGEKIRLTALSSDFLLPAPYLSNYLSQDLGLVQSNQTVNLAFSTPPLLASSAAQVVLPPSWQPGVGFGAGVFSALPGMPSFHSRSGSARYPGPADFILDYFVLPGAETTARVSTESRTAATCAAINSHRRNVGGSLGSWTLPGLPTDLSPGRTECAPFGTGFGDGNANPSPAGTYDLEPGDFNEDGFPDLIVGSRAGNQLLLYFNDGLGHFTGDIKEVESGVNLAGSVEVADLDRDGHLDLLVEDVETLNVVMALYGLGDGSFEPPVEVFLNKDTGGPLETLTVGDFNGDGALDFAVTELAGPLLFIVAGDGSRNFALESIHATAPGVFDVKRADVNNDRVDDLLAASHDDGSLLLYFGSGGGVSGPDTFTARPLTFALDTGDLDGDGFVDVVTTNLNDTEVSVWTNDGTGFFKETQALPVASPNTTGVVVADFTGDGELDVAVANEKDLVLFVNKGGALEGHSIIGVGPEPRTLIAEDLNGDGAMDVAAAVFGNDEIWWSLMGRPAPAVPASTPFTLTAPVNTRLMKLERGAFRGSRDWVYFSPAGAGPTSVRLPLPASVRPFRSSPNSQLSSWSTTLVLDPAPIDVNNLSLQKLEPETFLRTGARAYLRQ